MSRTKQSLDAEAKFLSVVASKGGRTTTPYLTAREKVTITCPNNHTFHASPTHISNDGQWCTHCPSKVTLELLNGFYDRVKEMKGAVIGPCVNAKDKTTIQCSAGHTWNSSPSSVYKTGVWCPDCDKIKGLSTEDRVRSAIAYRGGILVSEYRSNVKLRVECEEEHEFDVTPHSILQGNWCVSCSPKGTANEKFEEMLRSKNGRSLNPFVNTTRIITLQCQNSHQWDTTAGHIIAGSWCPTCPKSSSIIAEANFRDKVTNMGGTLLTPYQGIHSHVTIQCGNMHQFTVEPNSIMSMGTWCAKCSGCCPIQAGNNFKEEVFKRGGIMLGIYTGAYNRVRVKCAGDHEFDCQPHSLMTNRSWCAKCSGKCPIQAAEKFYRTVTERGGVVLGTYVNSWTRVPVRCSKLHEWNCVPGSVNYGDWCRSCHESKGERAVRSILQKHNISFTPQKEHPSLPGHRYDFYFLHNGKEFYLEYDGEQHFTQIEFFCKTEEAFQRRRDVDVRKSHTVITNNGHLIRLDYTLSDEQLESHILTAIQSCQKMYVTNTDLYGWITEGVDPKPIDITLNLHIRDGTTPPPIRLTLKIIK